MIEQKHVLCLMAHPDDAEILSGGTLALLSQRGWKVTIATMTPGQAGSETLGPEEISVIRRNEAMEAAKLLGGDYHCLECEDVFIAYDKPTLVKVVQLFRTVKPDMVLTASPSDYMLDHEITSHLAQTACMAATIKNISISGLEPLECVPYLYYADPVQGKDRYGHRISADILVDITSTMDIKEQMLACHKSQRDWLRKMSNVDEYLIMMKEFSTYNGTLAGCAYAEGYRQHLGFSYPQGNLLKEQLQELVHLKAIK